jgi:hypothetical protein
MTDLIAKYSARALLILGIASAVAAIVTLKSCHSAQTAKTETRLATGQASASLASGTDAVDTAGNVQANAIAADLVTKENQDAIRNAEGSTAPVATPVRDAGLASLCRRAAYRGDPKCVQFAPAR